MNCTNKFCSDLIALYTDDSIRHFIIYMHMNSIHTSIQSDTLLGFTLLYFTGVIETFNGINLYANT